MAPLCYRYPLSPSSQSTRGLLCGGDTVSGVAGASSVGAVANGFPIATVDMVSEEDIDCFDRRFGLRIRVEGSGKLDIADLILSSRGPTAYSRILRSILRMSTMDVSLDETGLKNA